MPQPGILTYLSPRDADRDNSDCHDEDGEKGENQSGVPHESFRDEERKMIHGLNGIHVEFHFHLD